MQTWRNQNKPNLSALTLSLLLFNTDKHCFPLPRCIQKPSLQSVDFSQILWTRPHQAHTQNWNTFIHTNSSPCLLPQVFLATLWIKIEGDPHITVKPAWLCRARQHNHFSTYDSAARVNAELLLEKNAQSGNHKQFFRPEETLSDYRSFFQVKHHDND